MGGGKGRRVSELLAGAREGVSGPRVVWLALLQRVGQGFGAWRMPVLGVKKGWKLNQARRMREGS